MQILFSFTINLETKEAAFSGNISAQQALTVLQQLVVAEAIREAENKAKSVESKTKQAKTKAKS